MAINIKELFTLDAHNIHVDKINYNFDQIVANSGGPKGIKGEIGITGDTGQKGEKGEVGAQGLAGSKGEPGTNSDLWHKEIKTTDGGESFNVLKPFSIPNDDDGFKSRVVLGERASVNGQYNTTELSETMALLHLIKDEEGVTNQIILENRVFDPNAGSNENDERPDPNASPRPFKIRTDYEVGTGTKLVISGESGTNTPSTEDTTIEIIGPNAIKLETDQPNGTIKLGESTTKIVSLKAQSEVNIESNNSNIIVNSGGQIDIESSQISIQGPGGFGGTIDITSFTNTIAAPQSGGTNTISANSKNTITSNNTNEILADGGKNLIRANNATNEISAEVNSIEANGTNNMNVLQNSGVNKFITEDSINTSTQNILFNQAGVNLDAPSGFTTNLPERGEGMQFLEGGDSVENDAAPGSFVSSGLYAAANFGSTEGDRTLNDYFVKLDWTDWKIDALITTITNNIPGDPGFGLANRGTLTTAPNGRAPLAGSSYDFDGVVSTTFKEGSYIKIGDFIQGHGTIAAATNSSWATGGLNGSLAGYCLFIELTNKGSFGNLKDTFPFVNTSASPIQCDMTFTINSENSQLGEYPHIKGIIYPNSNRIFLYRMNYTSSNKIFLRALTPQDIYGSTGTSFLLSFKFSMIANNQQSYSRKNYYINYGFSDRNLKTNIVKVGESSSGYNIYEFNFIDNLPEYVIENLGGDPKGSVFQGVIADELPSELVARFPGEDFDRVNYGGIDVEFKKVR